MPVSNRDSTVKIKREYDNRVFKSILYAYVREDNYEWLRQQVFKHRGKLSHFVDYLITQSRKKAVNYVEDDYLRSCGIKRQREKPKKCVSPVEST